MGEIESIGVNSNGFVIFYVGKSNNTQRELVVVFHELGTEEIVKPCYTEEYENRYSMLCRIKTPALPFELEITMNVIVFLMFVFLITAAV